MNKHRIAKVALDTRLRDDERRSPILTAVRSLMPARPLSTGDARSVAERQALRLRQLLDQPTGALSIERLTNVFASWSIEHDAKLPFSGFTTWNSSTGSWFTIINGNEPEARRRFSIGHELKHVIDHPFVFTSYLQPNGSPWLQADIELLCDYFAGCLLLPRPSLKQAYVDGLQTIDGLAAHFEVSSAAVRVRLGQLGLDSVVPLGEIDIDDDNSDGYRRTTMPRTTGRQNAGRLGDLGQPKPPRAAQPVRADAALSPALPPLSSSATRMGKLNPIGVPA